MAIGPRDTVDTCIRVPPAPPPLFHPLRVLILLSTLSFLFSLRISLPLLWLLSANCRVIYILIVSWILTACRFDRTLWSIFGTGLPDLGFPVVDRRLDLDNSTLLSAVTLHIS